MHTFASAALEFVCPREAIACFLKLAPMTAIMLASACMAAAQPGYTGLICRGVEESGRLFIGQPGFGPHLISLFVTGPNPLSATQTLPEHVAWINDPLHSYVADGTGGLCVWAHPGARDAQKILGLPGLAGLEVHYAGGAHSRDGLWDEILRGCVEADRPFLWAYAADDTHSRTNINLSWYAALVPSVDERSLKAALRGGAIYVSNGPTIETIQVRGSAITIRAGQPSDIVWLRAGQHLAQKPGEWTVTIEPGEQCCVQLDRGVSEATLDLAALGIAAGELEFVRAIVQTEPQQVALTEPWRVREGYALENPYPESGTWVRGQTHNHTDGAPGNTTAVVDFRLAYQAAGQLGAFSTDYSYWESPYQWTPDDGTPQVLSITPARCPARERGGEPGGEPAEVKIAGINLGDDSRVQIGTYPAEVVEAGAELLVVRIPADLPPATYDVCVTSDRDMRGTLPLAFTVQSPDAINDGWQSFGVADGMAYPHCTSAACFGDQVWVGSVSGASGYRDGQWTTFRREMAGRGPYAMVADPAGGVWMACDGGLVLMDADGQWQKQTVGEAEKATSGRAAERWGRMAFDAQGRLWVANRWAAGLGMRDAEGWHRLTAAADGIPNNSQAAVGADTEGGVWVGFGNGLYRLIDGQWQAAALPEELAGCTYISALAPAAGGVMWAAVTSGSNPALGGVVRLGAGGAVAYTPANSPLPSARIRDVLVARSGDVWFAADLGVARLDPSGEWTQFTAVNSGLGCDTVLGLAEDAQGRIWMATAEGASCFAPGA